MFIECVVWSCPLILQVGNRPNDMAPVLGLAVALVGLLIVDTSLCEGFLPSPQQPHLHPHLCPETLSAQAGGPPDQDSGRCSSWHLPSWTLTLESL